MAERITEIINNAENIFSYSFEVTPNIKDFELESLDLEPKFFSITWYAREHEYTDLEIAPIKLAKYLRSKGKNVLLHISCCNMRKNYLDDLLVLLKDIGICNLFIILGEKFDSLNSDFGSSQDMIIHIRRSTGNCFCIGVAGFPERGGILQLKEKVKCGVDFILTQAFFEFKAFKKFIMDCKEADINVPIIPGIFPFQTEKELQGFMKLCQIHDKENIIIKKLLSNLSGLEIVTELVHEIVEQLQIKHIHFFTLNNMQRTTSLVRNIIK